MTDQWRHVASDLNPADDVSRGLSADDIVGNQRWISGPSFLHDKETDWPASHSVEDVSGDDPEDKHANIDVYSTEATKSPTDTFIEGYSSWYKLRKGVAMMLRVRRWLQNRVKKVANIDIKLPLEAGELRTAERAILMYIQAHNFSQEILDAAMDGNAMPKPRPSRRGSLCSL